MATKARHHQIRTRIIKIFIKIGTIISLGVIFTFVVFGYIFYDGAYEISNPIWVCVIVIPLLGYIIGFVFSFAKAHFCRVIRTEEIDWSEIKTISLACGLQNTQFAMSSIFASFYGCEYTVKMHAYSPMYGVIELAYAFALTCFYKLWISGCCSPRRRRSKNKDGESMNEVYLGNVLKIENNFNNLKKFLRERLDTATYNNLEDPNLNETDVEQVVSSVSNTLKNMSENEISKNKINLDEFQLILEGLNKHQTEVRKRSSQQIQRFRISECEAENETESPNETTLKLPKNRSDDNLEEMVDTKKKRWWQKVFSNDNFKATAKTLAIIDHMKKQKLNETVDSDGQQTFDTYIDNGTIEIIEENKKSKNDNFSMLRREAESEITAFPYEKKDQFDDSGRCSGINLPSSPKSPSKFTIAAVHTNEVTLLTRNYNYNIYQEKQQETQFNISQAEPEVVVAPVPPIIRTNRFTISSASIPKTGEYSGHTKVLLYKCFFHICLCLSIIC